MHRSLTMLFGGIIMQSNNEVKLTLTNHKTTLREQARKMAEEEIELDEVIKIFAKTPSQDNAKLVADEMIDFIKANLKWLRIFCKENGLDFFKELENNHKKNEKRGYHE